MLYLLLPVCRSEVALDYVAPAVTCALYVGVLAALQMPSAHPARHLKARTVLVFGTLLSALCFSLAGLSGGLVGLCASLALAGAGGSTQHPLASAAISRSYGENHAVRAARTTSPAILVKRLSHQFFLCCSLSCTGARHWESQLHRAPSWEC
jgi:MFS family permease